MLTWKLAWRNLFRNRKRTVTAIVTIGGAVTLAILFTNIGAGSYSKIIDEGVRMGSGHIGFYREGYLDERKAKLSFQAAPILKALAAEPGVAEVYARQYVPGLVRSSRESRPVAAMGVDFATEMKRNPLLAPKRVVEGSLAAMTRPTRIPLMVIGADLARELGVKTGGKVVFMAQGPSGAIERKLYRVAAVVRTHMREIDQAGVVVARETLDLFTAPGAAHEISVLLASRLAIEQRLPVFHAIGEAAGNVDALPWTEAMPGLVNTIRYDKSANDFVMYILYFLVALGTANLLAMSVMERTREFGLVRALGLNAKRVRRAVFAEALLLGFAGIAAGACVAIPLCAWIQWKGIDLTWMIGEQEFGGALFEPIMTSAWDYAGMLQISLLMAGVIFAASLYPARLALKIVPAEAMRKS